MNINTLKSIMRIYAILVNHYRKDDAVTLRVRKIIENYVLQITNKQELNEYLTIFDFQFKTYKSRRNSNKKYPALALKAIMSTDSINKKLNRSQKLLFILNIIDILIDDYSPDHKTLNIISILGSVLNISDQEIQSAIHFICYKPDREITDDYLLIYDKEKIHSGIRHLHNNDLTGKILFLYNSTSKVLFFRNINHDDRLMLNSKRVQVNQTYQFTKGSSIRSFFIEPVYYSKIAGEFQKSDSGRISLRTQNITYKFPDGQYGVHPVTFEAKSGQLIGIMGGSGTGKTTLLNLLNGNILPTKGEIYINGLSLRDKKEVLKKVIGYIPQDDLLIEELTVFENLYFNARLCFADFDHDQIHALVNDLLTELDLYKIRYLKVGTPLDKTISGGQRKRVNIALELLREPDVLLIDEPTSGLSSNDSDRVMDIFKEQTIRGKLAIVNIHQPSSNILKLFDKLLILDVEGRVVYFGNPLDAVVYFKSYTQQLNADERECENCGNVNPEQILYLLEKTELDEFGQATDKREVSAREWYKAFLKENPLDKQTEFQETKLPEHKFRIPGRGKQFLIFFKRNVLSKISDKQYLIINFLEAPLLAFILAIVSKYIYNIAGKSRYIFMENENIPAFIFMSIIVAIFMGLMGSAEEIIRDRKIIKREEFLNLSRFSYINSKVILLLLISAIQTLLFVIVAVWILKIRGMLPAYWLLLFTVAASSNLMGLVISASLKSVVAIYITIPLLIVPQIILSGSVIKFDQLHPVLASEKHVPLAGDLMVSRWGYEALITHQYKKNNFEAHFYDIDQLESNTSYRLNFYIPEMEVLLDEVYKSDFYSSDQQKKSLAIIRNEMKKNSFVYDSLFINTVFTPEQLTDEIYENYASMLQNLRYYYSEKLKNIIATRDRIIDHLIDKQGSKSAYLKLKENYFNKKLDELVRAKDARVRIIRHNNELIRKIEPVFQIPESNFGRAPLFAGQKKWINLIIETYWFNICIIWTLSIILYLILYSNIIERSVRNIQYLIQMSKH